MARQEQISVSLVKSKLYDTTLQSLRSEAKELQQAFGSIKVGDSVKAIKEQASAAKEAAKAATEDAKAQKEAANAEKARYQAVKELENATKAHLQAQKEAQNVATAQVKTEKEAYNAIKAKEQAEKAAIQTQKAQLSLTKQQTTHTNGLVSSLRQMAVAYISIQRVTGLLRTALSEMKDMSDEMIVYQKVTKASADEMERIRASAYESAKRYGQTPTDFLSAASEMARAGYKENSAAMADLATKTKLVGDITAEEASRFLLAVDAGYQYSGSIEKLANVLDMTNEVSNNFATNTAKISEGMTLVASLGAQANIPIEQLIAALGTMTAATQRSGSEMARALRFTILNVLGDTTTEVEEGVKVAAEEVNNMSTALQHYAPAVVNAAKQSGKLINPMEAIGALAKAYKEGLIGTQEELFKLSKDIAGQRYYNAFAALIENWDTMYQEMLDKEAMAAGSADAEISVLVNSWTTKFNQLKTTWTELVNNSINEGFIKNLIDGTTHALEFAGSLENLATMAGGALFAIRSLSVGIKNLRQPGALMNLNTFGGFNLATGIAGIGVAAYGIIKSAYEANQRALQESAKKAAESAVASATTYTSLEELTRRYDEIAKDGIQEEKGELTELKSLQDQLNGLVGDQATAIDIVNGKYGETLTALKKLNEEQRKNLLETARANLSSAVASFIGADLNGEYFGNYTGVSGLPGQSTALMDYINALQYFRVSRRDSPDPLDMSLYLTNVPTVDKDIIQFYKELQDLYNYIGSHNLRGEKAGLGEKTIGEEQNYTRMYSALGKFLQEVEKTAKPVQTAYESVETLSEKMEEIGGEGSGEGTAEEAADAIGELTESVHTLTKSIENATTAKTKFDDAMKTSKADAFKDYMEAFDTFKQELDAGRVNSTAMYAAARMMLGQDAYNATGGTYAGVMQAMYNRGSAGTVLDAYQMLNTEYVDKQGRTIEGFGAYELLRRSGVFGEGELTDASGNIFIPELTDAQYEQISAAYGGVLVEVIMNALNALDQYDTKGAATESSVAADTGKAQEELGDSADKAAESLDKLSEAAEEEKKGIEGDGTGERVAQSAAYADTQTRKEQEEAKAAADAAEADRLQKQREILETAQEAYKAVDQVVQNLANINAMEANPALANIISNLEYLEKAHQIDIQTGNGTKVTEETIQAIQWAIQQITEGKNEGTIDVGLADNAIDVLTEQLHTAVSAMERNAGDADVEVGVSADTREAENGLDDLAEQKRRATIDAELGGKEKFESDVSELTQKETKFVEVTDNGTIRDTKESASEVGTSLDSIITKLGSINEATVNPEIIALIDGLAGIKEKYTFAVEATGDETQTAEQKLQAISSALNEIEKNKGIVLSVGLPEAGEALERTEQQLIADANSIISNVESSDELHDILISAAAGEGTFSSDILGMIAEAEQNSAKIGVELKGAVPVAKTLELLANPTSDGRTAEINVIAKKVGEFKEIIRKLTETASKVIEIEYKEPNHPSNTAETKGNSSSSLDYFGTGAGGGTMNVLSTSISPDSTYLDRFGVTRHATGTRYHSGGVSLVNDGNGPELLVSGGRAFIANGGKPALVNLQRGAKVFTASETRSILGGGVPAYADGVGNYGAFYGPALPGDIITKADYDAAKALAEETANGTGSEVQKEAKAFSDLKDLIDYIINRVGMALEEQTGIIDQQIAELRAQREAREQQNELEERQKAVAEAQKDMIDALNERTVRYLGEDGKQHWMADARNVQTATEALEKANQALLDYEDEMAFDAQIDALEAQKTALEDEYKKITKAWEEIQYGVNTPTGDLASLIAEIIATGSATDKKGAQTVQSLLIGQLLQGGIFKGNYSEALDSISKATGGNPIMPGESTATLASLIATTAAMGTGTEVTDAMKAASMGAVQGGAYSGVTGGGTQTNFNYFINGIQLGSDQAGQPLSEIMRNLTVYTNTGVA